MRATLVELGWRPVVPVIAALRTRLCAAALLLVLTLGTVASSRAADPPPSGRTFDSLTVRGTTYTGVTVVDITKRHVSFRSAQGFSTVLLEDLDAEALSQLGRGPSKPGSAEHAARVAPKNESAIPVHARENTKAASTVEDEDASDPDESSGKPEHIRWTARTGIAAVLLGLGCLAAGVAHIWLICAGFHKSILWGIVLLFGSFLATLIFCFSHWDAARRPVLLTAAGILVAGCGLKLWG